MACLKLFFGVVRMKIKVRTVKGLFGQFLCPVKGLFGLFCEHFTCHTLP